MRRHQGAERANVEERSNQEQHIRVRQQNSTLLRCLLTARR